MKVRKNLPVARIDSDFECELRKIAKIRLEKGLARLNPRELSLAEMTRLLRRTDGWKLALKELSFKPKRRENGR